MDADASSIFRRRVCARNDVLEPRPAGTDRVSLPVASVPFMRSVALLLCVPLAACAAGGFPGGGFPAPTPAPAAPAPAAASPSSGGGARGGATTAASRAAADPDAPNPTDDPVIQARADCWMK